MYAKKFRAPVKKMYGKAKKIFSSEYFLVKATPNSGQHNRFSVIIPASSVKSSVRRHFWKRAIADKVKHWPNFKTDFLFIVSPKINNLPPKNLNKEIGRVLEKAKI